MDDLSKDHIVWFCPKYEDVRRLAGPDLDVALVRMLPTTLRKGIPPAMAIEENNEVSEVYSVPRVTKLAEKMGLKAGWALDICTNYAKLRAT